MLALVGQHIKRKRALAMGIVLAGSSLGGVIWPIAIDKLLKIPRIGFPWTMRIVGFIMIPCLAFSCVTARSPKVPRKYVENANPSQRLTCDNAINETKDRKRKTEVIALLHKPEMQLLCLAMFITYFGMFSPFFYTTSYAADKNFPSSFGFYTVSIVNGASFFGRILPGIVADKYGKFNCCIISTLVAGIVAPCWSKVESMAGLGVWAAAYGFASGVSIYQHCHLECTDQKIGYPITSTSMRCPSCYYLYAGSGNRYCYWINRNIVSLQPT
jgi:MFS family permease